MGTVALSRALLLIGVLAPAASFGGQAREALQRAAALVEAGRLQEADREARQALSDPATRAAACSVLGAIRLRQDRLAEGVKLLQEAIRLEPRLVGAQLNLAEGLLLLATDYLKRGEKSSARALVEDSKRLPDVPLAWSVSFAEVLVRGGLVAEGIDVLERARKTDPASYELAFALGGAYVVKGDPTRALEAYDAALVAKPASVTALRQAAIVAEKQGELERSLSYWMRARKLAAADPEILLGFGRVCLKMDLLDDAEGALVEAAGQKPGEPAYQYTLAVAKVGKRQYEAAQALLEPLVKQMPGDAQLQYALGSVLYMQGLLPDAAARLQESLRLDAEQLASPYYLALVARDQGRDAEAIEGLEKLLVRYPDHAASCEALGGLLMNVRRYDEAERLLRKAVALNPKSVKGNYQLGLLLARTGRREEADKQLAMAKSLREEDDKTSRLQLRLLDPEG
ncbi:MAG: tetratricopeptide repeat protein [Burkholderiales bacterium]